MVIRFFKTASFTACNLGLILLFAYWIGAFEEWHTYFPYAPFLFGLIHASTLEIQYYFRSSQGRGFENEEVVYEGPATLVVDENIDSESGSNEDGWLTLTPNRIAYRANRVLQAGDIEEFSVKDIKVISNSPSWTSIWDVLEIRKTDDSEVQFLVTNSQQWKEKIELETKYLKA